MDEEFDFAEFEDPDEKKEDDIFIPYNFCIYCEVPMNPMQDGTYECESCGFRKATIGEFGGIEENSNGGMKMYSKNGNVFAINIDYSRTQKKQLMAELVECRNNSDDENKIPLNILRETAEIYNKIQGLIIDKNGNILDDEFINPEGSKKWVKRGRIKKETMGAILYYVLIKHGVARQKQHIVQFMGFTSGGLSKGIQTIEELLNKGKLKDELEDAVKKDPTESYIDRYLMALKLDNKYKSFIIDIINESVRQRVGLNSYNNSKIVGVIYLLIKKLELNISIDTIEECCDNKRKNTFTTFTNAIEENILKFYRIFEKHEVPTGIKGTVVKIKKFRYDEEIPDILLDPGYKFDEPTN